MSTFLYLSGQDSRPKNVDQTELVAQQQIHINPPLNAPDFKRQNSYHSVAISKYETFTSIPDSLISQCSYSKKVSLPNSSPTQCFSIPNPSDSIHKLVRLGGKQRPCALCKRFCKKTPCGDNIRTYYKCEKCDVPLCKGPIRNCYKEFHENLGQASEYVVLENTMHK